MLPQCLNDGNDFDGFTCENDVLHCDLLLNSCACVFDLASTDDDDDGMWAESPWLDDSPAVHI